MDGQLPNTDDLLDSMASTSSDNINQPEKNNDELPDSMTLEPSTSSEGIRAPESTTSGTKKSELILMRFGGSWYMDLLCH